MSSLPDLASAGLNAPTVLSVLLNVALVAVAVIVISTILGIGIGKMIAAGQAVRVAPAPYPPHFMAESMSQDLSSTG